MDSVRSFVRLWLVFSAATLAYAFVDLKLHPELVLETNFTMTPDLSQAGDLWHWGGRLLKERALSLLVCNALVVGGALALVVDRVARRRHRGHAAAAPDEERVSVLPPPATPSIPPP